MSKVLVSIANVGALKDSKSFMAGYNKVSQYRREKVDKIKLNEDKILSLGSGLLLDACLDIVGEKSRDIVLVENSKPVLKNSAYQFNLSHSGDYAMCVVSSCDVGCDIQEIKNIDLKIAERFFHNIEYETIISQSDYKSQIEMFFRYWTLKESFMKVTGKGFKLPLKEFEIVFGTDRPYVNHFINDKNYAFAELDAPQGYKASFCACDDNIMIENINIKIEDLLK